MERKTYNQHRNQTGDLRVDDEEILSAKRLLELEGVSELAIGAEELKSVWMSKNRIGIACVSDCGFVK